MPFAAIKQPSTADEDLGPTAGLMIRGLAMALTVIECGLFRELRKQNALPLGGDILQFGEASWYGDVAMAQLRSDIDRFAVEVERVDLNHHLDEILSAERPEIRFEIAALFWRALLQPATMTAIDFHGTPAALKQDLNRPLDLPRRYHAVMNIGTAEHVFNIAQLFKSVHDYTVPGGLMIHGLPFTGWVDHGFFNFNPTFYWDLAAANGYAMVLCTYSEIKPTALLVPLPSRDAILERVANNQIGRNSHIHVVMRKPNQAVEFRIPIQGYYAGTLSAEARKAWERLG